MFPVRLETERLVLREFEATDVDAVHRYAADPEVVRYMVWGPNTRADSEQFVLSVVLPSQRAEPRGAYQLAIVIRETGELIGTCAMRIQDATAGMAHVGYVLRRDCWGRGYVPEAVAAMFEFAFVHLGVQRIWSTVDVENRQSVRVLQKLGMRREGILRSDSILRGERRDSCLYAVLRDEWRAQTKPDAAPDVWVRPATRDDFPVLDALFMEVDELHRAARPDLFRAPEGRARSYEELDALLANDDALVIVAGTEEAVSGFAIAFVRRIAAQSVVRERSYVLLDNLGVRAARRREGFGARLVRHVEEWALANGATGVELGVHEFNAGARAFYEVLGYTAQLRKMEKPLVR